MNYTNECLYKDIYVIIEMMEDELKNRINLQFVEFLKENKNDEFEGTIDKNVPIKQQNLRKEIKIMMSLIYINYFCEKEKRDEILRKEKENIDKFYGKNIFNEIDALQEDEIQETSDFSENVVHEINYSKSVENAMIEYKENFFTKILKKIKSLFVK